MNFHDAKFKWLVGIEGSNANFYHFISDGDAERPRGKYFSANYRDIVDNSDFTPFRLWDTKRYATQAEIEYYGLNQHER